MFELVNKNGYVICKNVEHLGIIRTHIIPCKCIGYVSKDIIITSLLNNGELYMYGKINIKDFHLIEKSLLNCRLYFFNNIVITFYNYNSFGL